MSTHAVQIITIASVEDHPNADRLDIIRVDGWQVVVRKGEFRVGDKAIYIAPDYVVPTDLPEFAFLAKPNKHLHRLRAVRLRGELSFGLLIQVPIYLDYLDVGSDVMEDLGIVRYEPQLHRAATHADELEHERWPSVFAPKFDLESYNNFRTVIRPGENVIVTEKVHGANARYVYCDGEFFMGSRNRWIKPDADHIWSRAVKNNPRIEDWCRANEGVTLYGEVFGNVQGLKYGLGTDVAFVAFAAASHGSWVDQTELFTSCSIKGVRYAPVLYIGRFDESTIKALAEQDSVVSTTVGHMMEGVVIVPIVERYHSLVGRVALKYISNRYWESNEQ